MQELWDFRADHVDYLKVFKQLRGYFRDIHIGGSYAYSKELDLTWNGKDIDVFILTHKIESWALVNILNTIFTDVHTFNQDFIANPEKALKNQSNYYKIDNQWKRVVCTLNSMTYDLIFVDTDIKTLIENNTGSDISRLYYDINDKLVLNIYANDAKINLKNNECNIDYNQCTEAYASKIENICNKLGLKINGRN